MSKTEYARKQLTAIQQRIRQACDDSGRRDQVHLIGASKKQSPKLITEFHLAGLQDLGENYLQEALEKRTELADFNMNWHFIGQIQSNKTRLIAEHFDWVHSVDRLKIARRFSEQNPSTRPLQMLLQLNLDGERSKGGVNEHQAAGLADAAAQLPNITIRGFMLIPQARTARVEQQRIFAKARTLLEQTNQRYGLELDQLSMGMSGDLEAAIAEGSTMVRIGTDLFGSRS